MAKTILPYSLDDYFSSTTLGSLDQAIGNHLYGINHRQTPTLVPMNKDRYGLSFFVRPQLNLDSANIRNVRKFYPLLTDNAESIQRFVRTTLDPRLQYKFPGNDPVRDPLPCPFVDAQQCFIPLLSNSITSMSGWPDINAHIHTSKEGLFKEKYIQVDGTTDIYSDFDIDVTFKNLIGDVITYLFYTWINYSSYIFDGRMTRYWDYETDNMLDYNTRIYRLVLDNTKQYATKIACTGISIPSSLSIGSFFDFNDEKVYNDSTKDITIRFSSIGAYYNDDLIINHFNKCVQIFNPSMGDKHRLHDLVKIKYNLLPYFNNRGYPRLNPKTNELEWWVSKDFYQKQEKLILSIIGAKAEKLAEQDKTFIGD